MRDTEVRMAPRQSVLGHSCLRSKAMQVLSDCCGVVNKSNMANQPPRIAKYHEISQIKVREFVSLVISSNIHVILVPQPPNLRDRFLRIYD